MNSCFVVIIFFLRYLVGTIVYFSEEFKKEPGECNVPIHKPQRACSFNLQWIYFDDGDVVGNNLKIYDLNKVSADQCKKKCLEKTACFSIDFHSQRCNLNHFSTNYTRGEKATSLAALACCKSKVLFSICLLTHAWYTWQESDFKYK